VDIAIAPVISSATSMLPVLVPMAPSSTITIEDRTEARTRSTTGANAGDVETDPSLKYNAIWAHGNDGFTIAYTPRILFGDFTGKEHEFQILDGGVAALFIQHKRTTFQLNTFDQYGTIFANSLVIPTRWKGEGAPAIIYSLPAAESAKLTYVASYTNASITQALTPRLNLTFTAQMGVFGGPDEVSRQQLPLVISPNGEVRLEYRATKHDEIAVAAGVHYAQTKLANDVPYLDASGNQVYVGTGATKMPEFEVNIQPKAATVGYAEVRYRHHWSKKTYTELAAGVAVANQDYPALYQVGPYGGRSSTIPYPTGEFLTVYNPVDPEDRPRDKVQGVFDAKIEPWFSPFGGINEERVELASAVNFLQGKTTVRLQGGFYAVIPTGSFPTIDPNTGIYDPTTDPMKTRAGQPGTPGQYAFAMGELVIERKLNKYVTIDGGVRAFRQIFHDLSLNTKPTTDPSEAPMSAVVGRYDGRLIEYVGFIGLSWQTAPAKF
jgi:hypothetical protein